MKRLSLLCVSAFLLVGCHHASPSKPSLISSEDPTKVWVALKPVQCLGNPWEKEWLKKNRKKAAEYPIRNDSEIIKDFFFHKGFQVHDLRIRPYMHDQPLCRECNCARGDLLLMLVNRDDVSLLLHYGFQSTVPVGNTSPKR